VFETKGMTSRVMLKTKLSLKHQPLFKVSQNYTRIGRDRLHYGRHGQGMSSVSEYVCAEYEMTVTALRTLPEKDQKLSIVKNRVLEEETTGMTVRRIMRPKVYTDSHLIRLS
jgi:hypothetical protein